MMRRKLISIVTPCYNEEENIIDHFNQVSKIINPFKKDYAFEFIYTDNHSQDKTFEILKDLAQKHSNLKAIKFSRNIGANRSIFIGLSHAKGDSAVLIQADLQDPPQLIIEFIKGWESGFDVVYGRIVNRKEFMATRFLRKTYYKVISHLSDIHIPQNAGEFRIMSRRVLDALSQYNEDDIYLRGIIAHIGFKQKGIPYTRGKRSKGKSSTNFFSLVAYGMNGLLSSTVVPIRLTLFIGLFFSLVGFLLTMFMIVAKFLYPEKSPQGYTLLGTIVTLFAGVQMLSIGIIGEYIRKIYLESLKRPRGFIEEKINF